MESNIIPIVVGVLGTIPKSLEKNLKRVRSYFRKRHSWEQHEYSKRNWILDSVTKMNVKVPRLLVVA